MLLYENRLDQDSGWALSEGGKFFEERSAVQTALHKVTQRLKELGIPYAVAGGMALFRHGFRRFTEDVVLLVSPEGLRQIHAALSGRGYLPPFTGSKNLRDTESGVRIEFLVAGQYPGDGKPKPVAFPDPSEAALELDGVSYLNLPALVELKLASGMTSPERMKDLADVQELIRLLNLPPGFADRLHPFVREKYSELWAAVKGGTRRYLRLWPRNQATRQARTLEDLIEGAGGDAPLLESMRAEGVRLDPDRGGDTHACLVTTDPVVAAKYDMHEESEFAP